MTIKSIGVFCGSNLGDDPAFKQAAIKLGVLLAKEKIRLIYGGGNVGLMGGVANSTLDNGGEVIGVIREQLMDYEVGHTGITELKIVNSMQERKEIMMALSDAFVALPGGYGTLDELFEVITWTQLGLHKKPCVLLNINSFYDDLFNFLSKCMDEKFLMKENLDLCAKASQISEILPQLDSYQHVSVEKWIEKQNVNKLAP